MSNEMIFSNTQAGDGQEALKMYQISFTGPQAIESVLAKQSDLNEYQYQQQMMNQYNIPEVQNIFRSMDRLTSSFEKSLDYVPHFEGRSEDGEKLVRNQAENLKKYNSMRQSMIKDKPHRRQPRKAIIGKKMHAGQICRVGTPTQHHKPIIQNSPVVYNTEAINNHYSRAATPELNLMGPPMNSLRNTPSSSHRSSFHHKGSGNKQ